MKDFSKKFGIVFSIWTVLYWFGIYLSGNKIGIVKSLVFIYSVWLLMGCAVSGLFIIVYTAIKERLFE